MVLPTLRHLDKSASGTIRGEAINWNTALRSYGPRPEVKKQVRSVKKPVKLEAVATVYGQEYPIMLSPLTVSRQLCKMEIIAPRKPIKGSRHFQTQTAQVSQFSKKVQTTAPKPKSDAQSQTFPKSFQGKNSQTSISSTQTGSSSFTDILFLKKHVATKTQGTNPENACEESDDEQQF